MIDVTFTVPGVPVAQPRQRHTRTGHNYTPAKHPVNAFKAAVATSFRNAYQGPPESGPIKLSVLFLLPRPKRLIWKTKLMYRALHTTKPDLDNITKALKDALNELAWKDDSQVCYERTYKMIAAGDEQPHSVVRIESVEHVPVFYEREWR